MKIDHVTPLPGRDVVYFHSGAQTPLTGRKKSVLLACSGTGTGQWSTSEVDSLFRFVGVTLYPRGVDPLIEPFAELFAADPGLLHEPKGTTDWAALLSPYVPAGSKLHGRLTNAYLRVHLQDHKEDFENHFGMTTIRYRSKTWYMFSKPVPPEQLEGASFVSPVAAAATECLEQAA